MTWKIERWLQDVFPGKENIYSAYRLLSDRELAIVAGGTLDLALAELISLRLVENQKESESFLGLDASGNAPAGTFGARIQLAVLLGIITPEDARILRSVKNVRNAFAHRINVNFCHKSVQPFVRTLFTQWFEKTQQLSKSNDWLQNTDGLQELGKRLSDTPEAGEGLLLSVFTVYQAYFHRLSERIPRLNCVVSGQ